MLKIAKSVTAAVSIAVLITALTACTVSNAGDAARASESITTQITSNIQKAEAPTTCFRSMPQAPGIFFKMHGADCLIHHVNIELTR